MTELPISHSLSLFLRTAPSNLVPGRVEWRDNGDRAAGRSGGRESMDRRGGGNGFFPNKGVFVIHASSIGANDAAVTKKQMRAPFVA